MNIADILIILIIGVFTVMGVKNGLVRTVIRFGSLFLSLFIAFIAYPMFSGMFLESKMAEELSEKVSTEYVLPYMNDIISANLPEDTDATGGILNLFSDSMNLQAQNSAELISDKLTSLFINVAVFLVILVLCRVIFALLTKLLLRLADFPVIRQVNMLAGGILGFLQGLLICLLIISAVAIIAPMNKSVMSFDEKLQNSKIASQIYNNNFILNSISSSEK